MNATLHELLDLIVRLVHVIAGIMWIGNSLLFNWLDRNLQPLDQPKKACRARFCCCTAARSTRL